jgi:hypothetical protein
MSVLFFSSNAFAFNGTPTLTRIFTLVQKESATGLTVGEVASTALEALNTMDNHITIANQGRSMAVYHDAKIIRSYSRPDVNDVKGWVNLSNKIIRDARRLSRSIKIRDFEIIDTIMTEAFKSFNDGSRYHSYLEVGDGRRPRRNPVGLFFERDLGDGILYVRVAEFTLGTHDDIASSIRDFPDIKGLVLDLRGNEGGSLKGALSVIELFMDDGIIASARGRNSDRNTFYIPSREAIMYRGDIVILVDSQTASSAEVVAASMQEQSRALLVGTRTFGKGSVQTVFELPNNSTLALTTAYFYTPSGNRIEGIGIMPDICTFGLVMMANAEKLIGDDKLRRKHCARESRANVEFDIDVAKILLTTH